MNQDYIFRMKEVNIEAGVIVWGSGSGTTEEKDGTKAGRIYLFPTGF
jgi:methyl coenzyme M reductase subunit C